LDEAKIRGTKAMTLVEPVRLNPFEAGPRGDVNGVDVPFAPVGPTFPPRRAIIDNRSPSKRRA
jgi:hypothetical protein